ncbi:MAG: alpha-D-ribose 1-methylphosphonate 5-triphosphate diphosphatase [Pseudomonadota bacterium]
MTKSILLEGGRFLSPENSIESGPISISEGLIVDATPADAHRIECDGYLVLPGIVDVHGDAFELELHPRPGVDIAFEIAMGSVDRQLLANGITTAFHGLTLSWEPGARSLETGRKFMAGLKALRPHLMADHRVQFRWETFAHDAIGDIAEWMHEEPKPSLAFNDHTTATLAMMGTADEKKLYKWAQRTGCTPQEYMKMAAAVGTRINDVPSKVKEVASLAQQAGVVLLSHDDRTVADRQSYRKIGASVCEFPLDRSAAAEARSAGEPVIMGGPNVIRGGSHLGMLSAEDAVTEGLCTILASDYYYPSQLRAVQRLVHRGAQPIETAWDLVSRNPADAMGLSDRGRIKPGYRADLIVLDTSGPWRVVHVVAQGTVISFGR